MKKIALLLLLITVSCNNESVFDEQEQACDNGTFVGWAVLTSQQEVEDFGALCYTKIDGTLTIQDVHVEDDKITDLSPLSSLTEVYSETYPDSLSGSIYISTSLLTDLSGLENITRAARLRIVENEQLVTLNGLQGLLSIDGNNIGNNWLQIHRNEALTSLDGLNSLTVVGRNDYIGNVKIDGNPQLENINGLESLTQIITNEDGGLGGFCPSNLWIYGNNQLTNIDGLSSLIAVEGGSVRFFNCTDIIGPDNCTTFGFNENLVDFCGISNLVAGGNYTYLFMGPFNPTCYDGFAPTVQDIIDGNCSL